MKQDGNMKKNSRVRIFLVIALLVIAACAGLLWITGSQPRPENSEPAADTALPLPETAAPSSAVRAKPTVRPLTVHYNHTLPAVQLDVDNVEQYFHIDLGKEYSRGKKLVIPYTITPASPLYASYDGSTFGVYIKFCVYVYLTEEDMANEEAEPYYSKEYTVVLKRLTGLQESGAIDVLLKLDQDDVYYRVEVIGCNGKVGTGEESDVPAQDSGTSD